MAPATKKEAKAKLAVLKVGVGYPDTGPTYTGLEVVAGDAYGNAERAGGLRVSAQPVAKLGQPVDRSRVGHDAADRERRQPAGDERDELPRGDPAAAVLRSQRGRWPWTTAPSGAIIGHEISHSFDNQGAQFDATGRLHNWWTPDDLKHFEASAAQLVAQYDAYQPFPDLAVNGKQTLSENIADVAGLAAALRRLDHALAAARRPRWSQGFTGDQQFFMQLRARAGGQKQREPALRQRILTDGHAPDEYRAFTVRNIDAWYHAFDVQPGETLYLAPADRVRVW